MSDIKIYEALKVKAETLKAKQSELVGRHKMAKANLDKIKEDLKREGIESKEQLESEIKRLDGEIATYVESANAKITLAEAELNRISAQLDEG